MPPVPGSIVISSVKDSIEFTRSIEIILNADLVVCVLGFLP